MRKETSAARFVEIIANMDIEINKLQAENKKLRSILRDFLSTKECRVTWIEEMYSTIETIFEGLEEGE